QSLARAGAGVALVRRAPRRHEPHLVQALEFAQALRDQEVADVNRVEAAAEERAAHRATHGALESRGAGTRSGWRSSKPASRRRASGATRLFGCSVITRR